MKIGVSSYSYIRLVWSGEMDGFKIIKKAKEQGFDFIDFACLPPHDEDDIEYAKKLKECAETEGIEIYNYAVGADFINGSDKNSDLELQKTLHEVDVAGALGVKTFRHDCCHAPLEGPFNKLSFDSNLDHVAKYVREVTNYAKSKGIINSVENHGFYCQDADRVEKLVDAVNSENFGVLVDIGNFLCADEDPALSLGKLLPYATHIHAKDFIRSDFDLSGVNQGFFASRGGTYLRGTIIGHGCVNIKKCMDIIKNSGYDKTICVEYEGMEDVLTGIAQGKENLERFLGIKK